MPPLTVGLTGGVASGKSLAGQMFEALGVPLVDADVVARQVVQAGSRALAQIAQVFGTEYLLPDGTLDRPRMRTLVFGDALARKQLEAITHPPMFAALRDWRDAQTAPYCILSAAILIETGMRNLVQRILVVDTDPELQLARLQSRDGIGTALAQAMLAAQATREQRLAAADDVLENRGSRDGMQREVARLHGQYLALSAGGNITPPPLIR